jgi:hypothetical protein
MLGIMTQKGLLGNELRAAIQENRDVHLGCLVVHDARLTEFAQPLIAEDAIR